MYSTKKSIVLKLLGIFFIFSAFFSVFATLSTTSKNQLFIVYVIFYALIMLITAIGIFRLKPWARIVAIFLIMTKMIQTILGSINDINIMLKNSTGIEVISYSIILSIVIIVIEIVFLYFLTRPSIKKQFGAYSTQVKT